jgi:hypothetical protein
MDYKLTSDGSVAVDMLNEWRPMQTCPLAAKVQLLGAGGVAVYGIWNGRDDFWQGWCPLPPRPSNFNLNNG